MTLKCALRTQIRMFAELTSLLPPRFQTRLSQLEGLQSDNPPLAPLTVGVMGTVTDGMFYWVG